MDSFLALAIGLVHLCSSSTCNQLELNLKVLQVVAPL